MNRITKTLLLVALVLSLGVTQAYAYNFVTYFGEGANAYTLENTFMSSGWVSGTEGFESFAVDSQPTLNVAMGTITGGGYVANDSSWQASTDEYAVFGDNYFSNGNVLGQQGKFTFTLNFNTTQNAVGFYIMDPVDVGGIMDMTVTGPGGSKVLHMLDILGGAQASGNLYYVLLVGDSGFDSISFATSNNDGYGIDNISVATTPIPGAIWLLGAGLMGLVGFRRMRNSVS